LADKEPISNLADEFEVQPSQIHLWVKQLLDQAERTFPTKGRKRTASNPEQIRLAELQAAVDRKDALLGELLHQLTRQRAVPPSRGA
jgi:transposase-like protein